MSSKKPDELPIDPAGEVELGDDELEAVAGGMEAMSTECAGTLGCCGGLTVSGKDTCCCDTWYGCETQVSAI
jgi:hypothetical protein